MGHTFATISLLALVGCASTAEENTSSTAELPGEEVAYWEAHSVTEENGNTHLFIVNRAVEILGKHTTLPRAASAFARLNDGVCRTRWRQGLYDADHKVSYNNYWTWKSHFYDPSTGTNYFGSTDPVAYGKALEHLTEAKKDLATNDVTHGCYELGLALHYATDITQPMHATNFPATDRPLNLHSHLEERALAVQTLYVAADWSATPTGTVNANLTAMAWTSHDLWPSTWAALGHAVNVKCGDNIDSYTLDHTDCWQGDPGVDAAIGAALRKAQTGTAAFLYAADIH